MKGRRRSHLETKRRLPCVQTDRRHQPLKAWQSGLMTEPCPNALPRIRFWIALSNGGSACQRNRAARVAATTTTAKDNSAATLARMKVVRHSRSIFGSRSGFFTCLSLVS